MSDKHSLGSSDQFSQPGATLVHIAKQPIAIVRTEAGLFAVENLCPHKAAPLSRGELMDNILRCPLHGWEFDVTTGDCVNHASRPLKQFEIEEKGEELFLIVPEKFPTNGQADDGISHYLVRYGALGWIGHFGSIVPLECQHRDRVVIQTDRGLEIGELLTNAGTPSSVGTNEKPSGELVRIATAEDFKSTVECETAAAEFLEQYQEGYRREDLEVIECEQLLDARTMVLYYLGESSEEMGPLAVELASDREFHVMFQPVIDRPPVSAGCGTGGCGSGGCGSGGCGTDSGE